MKLFHSSFAAHECPKCKLRCLDTSRLAKHICIGKVPNVKRNHFDLVPADDYRHANNSILDQAKRLIFFHRKNSSLNRVFNLHKLTQSDIDDHDVNSNSFIIEEVQSLRCHFEGPYCNSFETEEELDRHIKLYHRYN